MSDKREFDAIFGFQENMWGHLFDADGNFKIPTRRPPIAKQLEKVWSIDNKDLPTNYISNTGAGGTSYRVSQKSELPLREFEDLYFRTFMENHQNPFKAEEILSNKVSKEEMQKTASVYNAVKDESPLLGRYYVSLKPFKSCQEANKFFNKHCKTATYALLPEGQETCKCGNIGYCSNLKRIVVTEVPYTYKSVNKYIKKAFYQDHLINRAETKNIIQIKDPKDRLKQFFNVINVKRLQPEAPKSHLTGPMEYEKDVVRPNSYLDDPRQVAAMVIMRMVSKGATEEDIARVVMPKFGTSVVRDLIPEVIRKMNMPINTYKFNGCQDNLKGSVPLLIKDSYCPQCVFYEGNRCGKYQVSFVNEASNPEILSIGRKLEAAAAKNEKAVRKFFKRCMASGVKKSVLKNAFNITLGDQKFNEYVNNWQDPNFVEPLQNPVPQQSYAADLAPQEEYVSQEVSPIVKDIVQMYEEGATEEQCKNFLRTMGYPEDQIYSALNTAVREIGTLNSVQWNDCADSDHVMQADKLEKTETCDRCIMNGGIRCNKFKKMFDEDDTYIDVDQVEDSEIMFQQEPQITFDSLPASGQPDIIF